MITLLDLFGSENAPITLGVPNRLQGFCNRLPNNSFILPKRIIDEHTLFPLYRPFLTQEKASKIEEAIIYSNRNVSLLIGIYNNPVSEYLRFCPLCIEEDIAKYGETYWHRSHQIAAVTFCPIHYVELRESGFELRQLGHKQFYPATKKLLDKLNDISRNITDIERKVSYSIHWLLQNNQNIDIELVKKNYLFFLHKKSLSSYGGNIKSSQLIKNFLAFFEQDYLSRIKCDGEIKWLIRLLYKNPINNPIKHILFIIFLGVGIAEFFMGDYELLPFGRPPWPCLNPAADHYGNLVVDNLVFKECNGRIIGSFKCQCGYEYYRRGPDIYKENCFVKTYPKSYGSIWEDKVNNLIKQGYSMNKISKVLKCDYEVIKNYMNKNNDSKNNQSKLSVMEDKRRYCRERLKEILEQNPNITRSKFKLGYTAEAQWLYRCDREWFYEQIPLKPAKIRGIDWKSKDKEISIEVVNAIKEIKNRQKKPVKITFHLIGITINKFNLLRKNLDRMPLTRTVIENNVETTESYRKKRIKYEFNELCKSGVRLSVDKILRRSSIYKNQLAELEEYVKKLILENKNLPIV